MLNTLKYVKILEEAGVTREQAETHVQIVSEIMDNHLATQQDMKDLRADVKADMIALRAELHADMATLRNELHADMVNLKNEFVLLEQRMTIKLGTIVSAGIGVAVALAKLVA